MCVTLIDPFLQFLPDLEVRQFLRADLDAFPSFRIFPQVRRIVANRKTPESPDFNPPPLPEGIRESRKHQVYDFKGLRLPKTLLFGQRQDQVGFLHGHLLLMVVLSV